MSEEVGPPEVLPPEVRHFAMELIWRCDDCGAVIAFKGEALPDRCPGCGAPREAFYLVTED